MEYPPLPTELHDAILRRYPHQSDMGSAIREAVATACSRHVALGFADQVELQRLCGSDDAKYAQTLSEVLVGGLLTDAGLAPSHLPDCPDFLIEHEGKRIWVEVVAPEPIGIPAEWLAPLTAGELRVFEPPFDELLLRWTSAISGKAKKLIGGHDRNGKYVEGYIEKQKVAEGDAYVIAVNGCLLKQGGVFSAFHGKSQCSYAIEATLGMGLTIIKISRETHKAVGTGKQFRNRVDNHNGAAISTEIFLNDSHSEVSAIWAVEIDERTLIHGTGWNELVHNPFAKNPVPRELLPTDREVEATVGATDVEIRFSAGRTSGD